MRRVLPVLAVLSTAAALAAEPVTYWIGHHDKFVNIGFESHADVETIIGTCNRASGEVQVDLEKGTGKVSLTVPVASLKTGIDMRDEHLRGEKWLDAAKFPEITFVSKEVKVDKDKGTATVKGDFTCHGVTKEKTVTVTWKLLPKELVEKAKFPAGDWLKFTTEFDVVLSEHGVQSADLSKVSDTIKIKVALFASTAKIEKK